MGLGHLAETPDARQGADTLKRLPKLRHFPLGNRGAGPAHPNAEDLLLESENQRFRANEEFEGSPRRRFLLRVGNAVEHAEENLPPGKLDGVELAGEPIRCRKILRETPELPEVRTGAASIHPGAKAVGNDSEERKRYGDDENLLEAGRTRKPPRRRAHPPVHLKLR